MGSKSKFWVAALAAAVIAVLQFVVDSGDAQQWGTVITAVIGAIAVYAVPNKPKDSVGV